LSRSKSKSTAVNSWKWDIRSVLISRAVVGAYESIHSSAVRPLSRIASASGSSALANPPDEGEEQNLDVHPLGQRYGQAVLRGHYKLAQAHRVRCHL
jgi:hypothetical protein